jgi:hypothetical protein
VSLCERTYPTSNLFSLKLANGAMDKSLHGMLVICAVIVGMSSMVFPTAAESILSKEMGKKWGDKCVCADW